MHKGCSRGDDVTGLPSSLVCSRDKQTLLEHALLAVCHMDPMSSLPQLACSIRAKSTFGRSGSACWLVLRSKAERLLASPKSKQSQSLWVQMPHDVDKEGSVLEGKINMNTVSVAT